MALDTAPSEDGRGLRQNGRRGLRLVALRGLGWNGEACRANGGNDGAHPRGRLGEVRQSVAICGERLGGATCGKSCLSAGERRMKRVLSRAFRVLSLVREKRVALRDLRNHAQCLPIEPLCIGELARTEGNVGVGDRERTSAIWLAASTSDAVSTLPLSIWSARGS